MRAYRDFRTHPKSGNRFALIFRAFSGIANLLQEARFEQCKYRCGREKQRMRQVVGDFARVKNMRISAYTRVLMCLPDSGSNRAVEKANSPSLALRVSVYSSSEAWSGIGSDPPLPPLPKGGASLDRNRRLLQRPVRMPGLRVLICIDYLFESLPTSSSAGPSRTPKTFEL